MTLTEFEPATPLSERPHKRLRPARTLRMGWNSISIEKFLLYSGDMKIEYQVLMKEVNLDVEVIWTVCCNKCWNVPFIVSPNKADLSHRKPASAGNIRSLRYSCIKWGNLKSTWTLNFWGLRLPTRLHYSVSSFGRFRFELLRLLGHYRCRVLSFLATRLTNINLIKSTGHVMHQQFNIQQLYVLPALYLCVLYLSENKQRLVPLTSQTNWFL